MNKIIVSGIINNIEYKLVDKGKVYAIVFIKLEVRKVSENILIISKNNKADEFYRNYIIGDEILIEGYLRKTKKDIIIVARDFEKIENKSVGNNKDG